VKVACVKIEFYVVALALILYLDESVIWIAEFYFITN